VVQFCIKLSYSVLYIVEDVVSYSISWSVTFDVADPASCNQFLTNRD
jgi:hypothetical protein